MMEAKASNECTIDFTRSHSDDHTLGHRVNVEYNSKAKIRVKDEHAFRFESALALSVHAYGEIFL